MFDGMIYKLGFLGLVCASVLLLAYGVKEVRDDVPDEDRKYMDPLPPGLKLIWPLVNLFAYYVGDRLPIDWLERYNTSLRRSGLNFIMTPAQYFGFQLAACVLALGFGYLLMWLLQWYSIYFLVLSAVLGFFMPVLSLRDRKKKREKQIVKALPTYLDFLTMAVQAGMNLTTALQQSVGKGPDGPLRVELEKVLRDIKAGMNRVDALRAFADRVDISEITAFVGAVVQAEKTGASIGNTLKVQADQRRVERFQRAEKLAMEAPVKLIFPLVAFIFPMTFMVLMFPIAMKLLHDV